MMKSLYGKSAGILTLVLLLTGFLFFVQAMMRFQEQQTQSQQAMNRELASNLAKEMGLVGVQSLNLKQVESDFHKFMMINPAIEVYLVGLDGELISYAVDTNKIQTRQVDLDVISQFLTGDAFPILGIDPKNVADRKVFSVSAIPSPQQPQAYLYVILQGELASAQTSQLYRTLLKETGTQYLIFCLGISLLLGLWLFRRLTKRLAVLGSLTREFRNRQFAQPVSYQQTTGDSSGDEIAQLGDDFDEMVGLICHQMETLKQQDASRRQMFANISHDIRTPLTVMGGYLQTMHKRMESLSPEQREEYVSVCLRHSVRLEKLVNDLFELSVLQAKDKAPNWESFQLAELVCDVIHRLKLKAEGRGVSLEVDMPAELPFVRADLGLIERVLVNLVDNAIDHCGEGESIVVQLRPSEQGVSVAIADTGEGIEASCIPHIFDAFWRKDDGNREGKHAGLGLAISQQILKLHGQSIRVESELGVGSTFRFKLSDHQSFLLNNLVAEA